jgi:AbrB family looped-hinge helix DNA binding protein
MKTTIDAAGRLVIPKEVRRQAGLQPGMPLEVRWQNGHIEIEPAPASVKLVRKGRYLVAVAETEAEPLTADEVEATRQATTMRRAHKTKTSVVERTAGIFKSPQPALSPSQEREAAELAWAEEALTRMRE